MNQNATKMIISESKKSRIFKKFKNENLFKKVQNFNEKNVKIFDQKMERLSQLSIKNIVKIFSFDYDQRIIEMEHIVGKTLQKWINERIYLNIRETLFIFIQIVFCLEIIYENKIIHNDLKPQNIMIDTNLIVKIIDWESSMLLDKKKQYSKINGSIHYSAPEKIENNEVTLKSDIYSVGIMFLEAITGINICNDENQLLILKNRSLITEKYLKKILKKEQENFASVIFKMIAYKPYKRYDSWKEIREQFQENYQRIVNEG